MQFENREEFDYVVNGEGEALLLEILEEIELGKLYDSTQLTF